MEPATQTQDWMVLECRACGARMKSLRDVARTSRILCPQCRTPVPVVEPGSGDRGEFRADVSAEPAAPARQRSDSPLPNRGRPDFEMQGETRPQSRRSQAGGARDSGDPTFDGSDSEQPELRREENDPARKRRRKKRRRSRKYFRPLYYLELKDWNSSDLAGLPEAEISADPWTDIQPLPEDVVNTGVESEWVVEEIDEDGNPVRQIKKVRRRPIARFAQLFFRRFTRLSRGVALLLVGVAAGAGVYGLYVLQQKFTAPPVKPLPPPAYERTILTSDDFDGAQRAVKDFMAADGVEEKLKYVRLPNRVRPLMLRWYRDHTAGPLQVGDSVRTPRPEDKQKFGTSYIIFLAMPVVFPDPLDPDRGIRKINYFAVEEIRDDSGKSSYKVDWETSVGYQEMSFDDFELQMPRTPQVFRVSLKLDDYYTSRFPKEDWVCTRMTYPGRDEVLMYGYIRRGTGTSLALGPLLERGASMAVIVGCRYPDPSEGGFVSRKQVIIERLEHDSWYYSSDAAAATTPVR